MQVQHFPCDLRCAYLSRVVYTCINMYIYILINASYAGLIFHTSSFVKIIYLLFQILFQDPQLGSRMRSVGAVWDGIPNGLCNASHWCDNIMLYPSVVDYFHVSEPVFSTNKFQMICTIQICSIHLDDSIAWLMPQTIGAVICNVSGCANPHANNRTLQLHPFGEWKNHNHTVYPSYPSYFINKFVDRFQLISPDKFEPICHES